MTATSAETRHASESQWAQPAAPAASRREHLPVAKPPITRLPSEPQPPTEATREERHSRLEEHASSLPVDSFEPAELRLAEGERRAPVFVITHGAGGTAEWHCQRYAMLLGRSCTLLCLKGKRMFTNDPSRGYYYPNHIALGQEISRARESMLARYAERIEANAVVYAGYSQGASMGVLATAEHGNWFPRMLLVEGGYESWSGILAKRYAASGGRRVLFVCGTDRCRKMAAVSVSLLRQHHVQAELRFARGAGHRPDGPVAEQVREGLPWLLADGTE